MNKITRRAFLSATLKAGAACAVSNLMVGCNSDDDDTGDSTVGVRFDHGVASGDPLSDSVIIWTRATPDTQGPVTVTWEISTDPQFASRAALDTQSMVTDDTVDYTVKVDVNGLSPSTRYFYRFKANGQYSPVGETKTLPAVNDTAVASVKLAVFSCANYPKGYFNAYREAAKDDSIDAALHLGDYIYEYGRYVEDDPTLGPAYAMDGPPERALPGDRDTECLTLADYRKRYALYRTDAGAQALHAKVPFICIWDDHEIANDTWKEGGENHQVDDGSFTDRKAAALQAYFEWLPIRLPTHITDQTFTDQIYRQFQFGTLVNLMMLETRLLDRHEQLAYEDYPELLGAGDSTRFVADMTDPQRSMLGSEQLQWLQYNLSASTQTWQVLGQQVLMGRMLLPAELLALIAQLLADPTDAEKAVLLVEINRKMAELVAIKTRLLQGDPTLTPEETARVTTVLPYNLDAWDGYFYEREVLLGTALQLGKNLVVLAGDTHNAFASDLKTVNLQTGQTEHQVGVEFSAQSVSSPGLEEYVDLTSPESEAGFEGAMQVLIDDLHYLNASNRGYLTVTFTDSDALAEWTYVDTIDTKVYGLRDDRAKRLRVTTADKRIEAVS